VKGQRVFGKLGLACMGLLFGFSLIPIVASLSRKVATFGRADVLFSEEDSGYRVRFVGESAASTRLKAGDLLLLVNGAEARSIPDPSRLLGKRPAEITLLRKGDVLVVSADASPTPWDVRYLFLFSVGAAFLISGTSALRQARSAGTPGEHFLFAGFALSTALVLTLTPVPPVDGFFKLSVLLEDAARALFPAFLLKLVLTFPRRMRAFRSGLAFLPAGLLLGATAWLYLGPKGTTFEAARGVVWLDRLQIGWMALAAAVAATHLLALSRRRIDLLTEKQVRFLLFGTAVGLLPLCLLNLLPRLFGGSIPVLSSLSLLPIALVPAAFLAALTRYRLWDVEVIARESAALVGAILVGAGFFAGAQLLLAHPISIGIPYAKGALQTAAGLLLALSFVPVRRGLSTALTEFQYRDVLKERQGLLALVRELQSPRSFAEIRELIVSRVTRGLGITPAALLAPCGDGLFEAGPVDGGEPLALDDLPPAVRTQTTRLSRQAFTTQPTPAIARLRHAGFRTLAPITVSGRLLALFAVGDRGGRVPLSVDDQELLETVLAPTGLALDHARLYEELKAQAERYKALKEFHEDVVAGSAAAIAATDATGRFTSVNPAFAVLAGRPASALLGLTDLEVLPKAITDEAGTSRVEADFGGGRRVLGVTVSSFPGALPGSRARVYVLTDTTENARLEKALADRERLASLGALSAGVAHEVNTPLTGVAGFARLLLDETPAHDPRRSILEKIERQAFRASRLVGSLLDLARGKPRERTPLDPRELACEAMRALEDERAARGVTLAVDVADGLPPIAGHGDALIQVFVNLVKNGIEAASSNHANGADPPRVVLRVRASDAGVLFEVEDNGAGMTRDEAARVFEPFYSTKTEKGGTGLGLAIAGDIIRAHGGSLAVDSTPGSGSRFTVRLPQAT
jgi:two-component system NtrC family sensor kinase